jgi:hypothetical protein
MLHISFAATPLRSEGHLLRESEVPEVINVCNISGGILIPADSKKRRVGNKTIINILDILPAGRRVP